MAECQLQFFWFLGLFNFGSVGLPAFASRRLVCDPFDFYLFCFGANGLGASTCVALTPKPRI